MSYRIDVDAQYRYNADDLTATALTEAERESFRQAIEDALDARAGAGGPAAVDETEECVFVVEDGDSLARIAADHEVSYSELLALNQRDDLPNLNHIEAGDVVFVPRISPEQAAASLRDANGVPEGEAGFVRDLRDRGNALEYADDPSAIDYDAEIGDLAADIRAYLEALPAGERQAALQRFYDHDWVDAGPTQMAIEQAAPAAGVVLQESGHTGVESEAAAREIVADARAESDPQAALAALEAGYVNASERVRQALDRSSDARAVIAAAADWAAEPLTRDPDTMTMPQALLRESMERFDMLTEGLEPEFAAEVTDAMMTRLESAANGPLQDYGGLLFGPEGTAHLLTVLERIQGTAKGDAATERLLEIAYLDMNTFWNTAETAFAEGRVPSYVVAMMGQDGLAETTVDQFFSLVESGITGPAENYVEHLDELSYLTANGGAAMTPEQLQDAIDAYIEARGPEWRQRLEALEDQLADGGAQILTLLQRFHGLSGDLPANVREQLDSLLADPNTQLAVSMALHHRPELVRGEAGQALIETFAGLGITGADSHLTVALVDAYLRERVLAPAGTIDRADPATLQETRAQIDAALRNNPQLAALLDVSVGDLDDVARTFSDLVPDDTGDFDAARYGIDMARNFNNALDQLDGVFREVPFNRLFRTSALAIVGSGLANAIETYGDDPSLRNGLQVAVESARVGIDGAQLVTALFNPANESRWVGGLKLGGKFVHMLGAGLAGIDALRRAGNGDFVGAGLNAAVAGGVSYAIFGSSALAGPIGFGIAAVATAGLFAWDGIQTARHNSRFETQTMADFLRHAGFSEAAAHALIDQSGEGYSPVPILMRYGELHGLSREQTVAWINGIAGSEEGPAALAALRDNLHHTLDAIDGDVSRFEATADTDDFAIRDTGERPWFARMGDARPESAAQLDAILPILGIDPPVAPT